MKRNWTVLATVLPIVLYRYTRCFFVRYNLQKWLNLDWSVLAGKPAVHYVFTATFKVPRSVSYTITTLYDAWKTFILQMKLDAVETLTNL